MPHEPKVGRGDGGAAFPHPSDQFAGGTTHWAETGMSLRDYFAAKAMQAILSVLHEGIRPVDIDPMARDAYGIADAMLAARSA